jgi:hypothetical protein
MVHFWSIGDGCCCLSKWNTPKTFMCPSSQLSPETGFISFGNIESEIACLGFSKTNPDEAYRHLGLSQGRGSFDMAVPLERYRYQEHEPWPFTIKHDLDGRTAPAKYLHVVPQELGEVGTRYGRASQRSERNRTAATTNAFARERSNNKRHKLPLLAPAS